MNNAGYSKGDIVGMITIAVQCLRELLLEGKQAKQGDLGIPFSFLEATSICQFNRIKH